MLNFNFPIYLASSSPRRFELLKKMVGVFSVIEPMVDESNFSFLCPERLTKRNSLLKLKAVQKKINTPNFLIIAADTVVSKEGQIYGKPDSREQAIETLKSLGNHTHEVISGVCIGYFKQDTQILHLYSETTVVAFHSLPEEAIQAYIDQQKPFDKAGSYGIQELPQGFVKSITGDFDNIVGLPSRSLYQILSGFAS